jgi:hypothetical protein
MGIREILDALYIGAGNALSTAAILICTGSIIYTKERVLLSCSCSIPSSG